MRNERIALFVPSLHGGGAERVMVDLASAFSQRGIATDLVLAKAEGPYLDEVDSRVRIIDFGTHRVSNALLSLARYLKREEPVALLSTMVHANIVAVLAKIFSRSDARLILREANTLTAQAEGEGLKQKVIVSLVRWTYRYADHMIAISEGMAKDLVTNCGIAPSKISAIYNPHNIASIKEKAKEPCDHPWLEQNNIPVIVGMGRLTKQKDFATLIKAFVQVRSRRSARLLILGEGELRNELTDIACSLGVAEDVDMPGFIKNPYSHIARSSLFVFSSAWEGLGNALIQAFILGVPIVATDCPDGPREILEGGKWGMLVPVGDPQAMAKAMLGALDHEGGSTKSRTVSRFSMDKVATQYLDVLLNADGKHKSKWSA